MKKRDSSERLVYSTDTGRVCPECEHPVAECCCTQQIKTPHGDGIVRIQLEKKGRKGKLVTIISGISLPPQELKMLAKDIKTQCGTGGTIKNGAIEIQGDHRDLLLTALRSRGYVVKISGG